MRQHRDRAKFDVRLSCHEKTFLTLYRALPDVIRREVVGK